MKYDDASWHYGGDFPTDLPPAAGATHIGMFLAWAALNGLAGEFHEDESVAELRRLSERQMTPAEWFRSVCDEKFTDEDLNEVGNEFAQAYYIGAGGSEEAASPYFLDYGNAFPDSETLYHVPDTWDTFAILAPIIRARFDAWRN